MATSLVPYLALIITTVVVCGVVASPPYVHNLGCAVYPKIVPADPNHRYATYFIELQRCQGADTNPSRRTCQSTSHQEYNIKVFDPSTNDFPIITVHNDTKCADVCINNASACDVRHEVWEEDTCSCKCLRNETDVVECGDKKIWDRTRCRCVCRDQDVESEACHKRGGTWNSNTCTCKERDPPCTGATTRCDESGGVAAKYVVMIVVVENIVVLTVCAIVVRIFFWNNHKRRSEDMAMQ